MSVYEMERNLEEIYRLIKKEASAVRGACEKVVIDEANRTLRMDREHDKVVSEKVARLERALEGLSGQATTNVTERSWSAGAQVLGASGWRPNGRTVGGENRRTAGRPNGRTARQERRSTSGRPSGRTAGRQVGRTSG